MNLGALGYGAAALAFGLLTLLLGAASRGRRQGIRVLAACVVTVLWSGLLAWHAHAEQLSWMVVCAAELVRYGAWVIVLCGIAAPLSPRRRLSTLAYGTWGACAALYVFGPLAQQLGVQAWPPGLVLTRTGLALSILTLLLLEQIYRNANASSRAAVRPLVFGLGALMVYDVFLYSQAELLRGIVPDVWNARGFINAAAVPAIALAVRAQPLWSMEVFVSRQFVLYTGTLLAVGGYLLVIALGGYWVRTRGGGWGGVAEILFVVAAITLLVSLVMSQHLRRRAKVFLSKHFYRNKYDYRLEWLRFIETLSADEGDVRRVSVQAVAQIFSSPSGVLYLFQTGEQRYAPVARWPESIAEREFPAVDARTQLIQLLSRRHWIVDLDEGGTQEDLRVTLELPTGLRENRRARIIAPILQRERLLGFVILYSPAEPFELTYEDRDLLRTVGRHVATHLAQQEADRELGESRQFEAYNKLTAFMMHDLKNSVAQLQLIVTNAQRHKHKPEFIDDVIDTAANTVERITRLIEQFRGADVPYAKPLPLRTVVSAAVERCRLRKPVPALNGPVPDVDIHADQERLTAIFEHVFRNAQDATQENGRIDVSFTRDGTDATVIIADTGSGMDAEFLRERLFRPFDSTKGAKGMGVGAYQVREYVRSLGGQVKVQSTPGSGTSFWITLPCSAGRTTKAAATDAASTSALATDRGS